ncbi:MAG: addiction module protein [Luteolibacter sp.]
MTPAVERLMKEALLLPGEVRTELVEALLEKSAPSSEWLADQIEIVTRRMENVQNGQSSLIGEGDAHRLVREALQSAG